MAKYTKGDLMFAACLLLLADMIIYHVLPVWQLIVLFNLFFIASLLLGADKLIEKFIEEEEEENV